MRHVSLASFALCACLCSPAAFASDVGLPTDAFVASWTALPTGEFTRPSPGRSLNVLRARAAEPADSAVAPLIDDAFSSARDGSERRGIALSQMTTSWDQQKRSAFQRLRDAESAYAGSNDARHARFVATLDRLIEGVGRSSASDGSDSNALESAYAATLARSPGDARVAAESDQARWRTYGDAFAAFADLNTPGGSDLVTAELQRQRTTDLTAAGR